MEFQGMDMNGTKHALFTVEDKFTCGALVQSEFHKPFADIETIYFDDGKDMNNILKYIVKSEGQVIMPKTSTGKEAAFVSMFLDREGNRIGLQHS